MLGVILAPGGHLSRGGSYWIHIIGLWTRVTLHGPENYYARVGRWCIGSLRS